MNIGLVGLDLATNGGGLVRLSFDLIAALLRLPEGHRIDRLVVEDDGWTGKRVVAFVRGPGMPELVEGNVAPGVDLLYFRRSPDPLDIELSGTRVHLDDELPLARMRHAGEVILRRRSDFEP